jgi:hypothetical protein
MVSVDCISVRLADWSEVQLTLLLHRSAIVGEVLLQFPLESSPMLGASMQ